MENYSNGGIPISPNLKDFKNRIFSQKRKQIEKKRLIKVSVLAVLVAVFISLIAKVLVHLIDLVTNVSFYGVFDTAFRSPANNHLGLWVILVPVVGGAIVGLMALYGSKAIRGHGIPEAMEQI